MDGPFDWQDDGPTMAALADAREIDARPITMDDGRAVVVSWAVDADGRHYVTADDGRALYVGGDCHAARSAYDHAALAYVMLDGPDNGAALALARADGIGATLLA